MTLTEKTGHLAWCALVALALARQEQGELSPAQENLFLTRWLAAALKQRRFSRDVAQDIGWLLNQGRLLGVRAKLADKLGYRRMLFLAFTLYISGFYMISAFRSFGGVFFAFIWTCTGGAFFKPIISAMRR